MTVHAINASVDPGLIGKVTRLFNQTEADIATELLQNARRAGATRVVVTTTQHSHHSATLTIADNGRGIEDPTKLLRLGASGWDKETMRSEDPAGMGVFSLAGRRVRVTTRGTGSLGWSAVIEGADWTSGRDIEAHGCVRSMGTTFTVEISAGRIDEARLAGYDWYDRLARVESLRFVIKQGAAIYVDTLCGDLLNLDNPAVDAIAAELTVNEHGLEQVYQLNTDMLLQTDDNWDLEGASIAVVRGFESATCKLTPGILADYLDAAYFCHSDDRDCDSFDTQLRYWRSQSIILATSLLQGEEAATVASIEAAFHENLRWLIPADRVLRLEHGPSGTTIVLEPLAAADTAAPSV